MRESRTYGSVRGARGNSRPYRVHLLLLRCMSPVMALGVFRCDAQNSDAIGRTADIDWPSAPIASEAYDPTPTLASPFCCDAQHTQRCGKVRPRREPVKPREFIAAIGGSASVKMPRVGILSR